MPIILNYQVDVLDVFTLVISILALCATLRKKEFGRFYFIPKNENRNDVWIKSIKSDLYDLKFTCEPYSNMNLSIILIIPNTEKETFYGFLKETKPIIEIASIKENTIVKFVNCSSTKIHIEFKDKYDNHYTQSFTQEKINRRFHKNFWNLTFVGS